MFTMNIGIKERKTLIINRWRRGLQKNTADKKEHNSHKILRCFGFMEAFSIERPYTQTHCENGQM